MNATTHALKEAVKAFTRFHDDLTVTEEQSNGGSTLAIKMTANKDDFPKLVGQDGAMVKALRSILKAIGLATGRVIYLELDEPTVGVRLPLDKFSRDAGWDVSYVSAVMLPLVSQFGSVRRTECWRGDDGVPTVRCTVKLGPRVQLLPRLTDGCQTLAKAIALAHGGRVNFMLEDANGSR